jgi:acyl-lipid omega-6 desaturase (Delta-12 desaturase)
MHDKHEAGLLGSTYLLVPWYLKWSTLGIEYHHIHHLTTRIPCYKLQECHEEASSVLWETITVVDRKKAFAGYFNAIWDDKNKRFESFPIYNYLLSLMGLDKCN